MTTPTLGNAAGLQDWSTSSSKTIAITTVQANEVLVLVAAFEQSTGSTLSVSSVTDTAGLTWAKRKAVPFTSSDGRKNALEIWWAKKPTSGATTITVTANVTIDDGCIMVAAFRDLPDPDSPWDTNGSLPASTTNTTATNVAPTATVSTTAWPIIFAFSGTQFGATEPSGFTELGSASNVGGASAQRLKWAYKIDYTGPQTSLAVTGTGAVNNNAFIVDALKFASAAGVSGTLAATEAPDVFSGAGFPGASISGALAATEAPDVFSGAGFPGASISGALAATEAPDVFSGVGFPGWGISYSNLGGTGPRQFFYTLSGTFPPGSGSSGRSFQLWLDGAPATFTSKFFMTTGVSTGTYLEVLCKGQPRVITGYKIYNDEPTCSIVFDFEGWDGSSWVTLSTDTMGGASPKVASFANTTAYQKYRFHDTGGTWAQVQFSQIEFDIDGGGADVRGDRTATITCTTTFANASGTTPSHLVDGANGQSSADAWWPPADAAASGQEIRFQFATARCLKTAFLLSDSKTLTSGVWQWQYSDDGSTWTDIGSNFTWTLTATNNPTIGDLSSNTGEHTYYRMLGVSGALSTSPYYREINFEFAAPATSVSGTLAATEAPDVLHGEGFPGTGISGTLAATEAPDVFHGDGYLGTGITGTLAATEAPDVFQGVGGPGLVGSLSATEAPDEMVFIGGPSTRTRRRQFFVT